ncbi:phosphotransferase [Nocardia wallacei]|uniref:phosphotransferase n=1 Tax=Nocardia wallacei TaxID=480035 RepID=UPI0024571118|nr:phosphotransferase [Nocardia wallacei]
MGHDPSITAEAEAPIVYSAEDLADFPAVHELLDSAGLGTMVEPVQLGGRNPNWVTRTTDGRSLFVKYELGSAHDGAYSRAKIFHRLLERHDQLRRSLSTPSLHAASEDGRVQVYEVIPRSPTAQARLIEGTLRPAVMRRIGTALGTLHATTDVAAGVIPAVAPLPSSFGVGDIDDSMVPALSAAQLAALRLVHGDSAVHSAATELLSRRSCLPVGPIHGDLRLDQILVSNDDAYWIIDWEEFGTGCVTRDLGSLIGDIINAAVVAALCDSGKRRETYEATVESALRRAKEFVVELGSGYRDAWCARRPEIPLDRAWAAEVTGFAGWHQFDRLLANAEAVTDLSAQSRALAGIGRALLLDAESFITEFDLDRIIA